MQPNHAIAAERRLARLQDALGDQLLCLLADDTLTDIARNPDGQLYAKYFGKSYIEIEPISDAQAERVITTVATLLNLTANAKRPLLEGELGLHDCRFQGALPPSVKAPMFAIRRPSKPIPFDTYIERGIVSQNQGNILRRCLTDHHNIVVAGQTGSGKTTLLNSLLGEIAQLTPTDRVLVLEDTAELSALAGNFAVLRTTENVTLDALIRGVLRFDPDRIIVGEVRDEAALALLKLWWTGHGGGVVSLHANGQPRTGTERLAPLYRLEQMISRDARLANPLHFITEAVDTFVTIAPISNPPYRRITAISRVGWRDGGPFIQPLEN